MLSVYCINKQGCRDRRSWRDATSLLEVRSREPARRKYSQLLSRTAKINIVRQRFVSNSHRETHPPPQPDDSIVKVPFLNHFQTKRSFALRGERGRPNLSSDQSAHLGLAVAVVEVRGPIEATRGHLYDRQLKDFAKIIKTKHRAMCYFEKYNVREDLKMITY